MLGSTTLDGPQTPVVGVSYRSNYNPDFNSPDVPQFDVGYLVLSSGSAQTPIKIAGSDEGALWDPGSPVDIAGWGDTSESGSDAFALRAATVQTIDDGTCSSDYGGDFDPGTMICAGFQSGGVDTCAGDQRWPARGAAPGGRLPICRHHELGRGLRQPGFPGIYTRVADTTLSPLVASDVASLESQFGLPHEAIFGSAAATTSGESAKKPFAKCKRIRDKKKRKRCVKKVRKRLQTA